MTYDHIHPRSKGGDTTFENVCLACRSCNEFKSDSTEVKDPLTGEIVSLFNPRTQKWTSHFAWSFDSTKVEGLTAIGRATVRVTSGKSPGQPDRTLPLLPNTAAFPDSLPRFADGN